MKQVKFFIAVFLFSALLVIGCSKDNNNPASATNTLTGTWKLSYTNPGDTLLVTLNINGSDNSLAGSGSLKRAYKSGAVTFSYYTSSGNVTGSYSDTNINVKFDDFSFAGSKSNSNYNGTASYISTTDTLLINSATLIKTN